MPRYPVKQPQVSSADTGGVAAVDRALLLLASFRAGESSAALAELADRAGLVKSTTLRLLASLMRFGFVRKLGDGGYALGPEIARLQSVYTASFSLEGLVMPVLRELVRKTRESAVYHVRQGDARLCLYRVDSPQPLRDHVQVGDLVPLDRGAGGRVILAFSGARGALYERIRRDGAAALVGDRSKDLAGIAAPVLEASGEVAGAVTLTMPAARYDERFIPMVRDAAAEITRGLGGSAAA